MYVSTSLGMLALITAIQGRQRVWPERGCKESQTAKMSCEGKTWGLLQTSSTSPKCFFGIRAKQQRGNRESQVMAGR